MSLVGKGLSKIFNSVTFFGAVAAGCVVVAATAASFGWAALAAFGAAEWGTMAVLDAKAQWKKSHSQKKAPSSASTSSENFCVSCAKTVRLKRSASPVLSRSASWRLEVWGEDATVAAYDRWHGLRTCVR